VNQHKNLLRSFRSQSEKTASEPDSRSIRPCRAAIRAARS
jgi:hypothetical protein